MLQPKTHDYTEPTWGHAVTVSEVSDGGQTARVWGFGFGVNEQDYLLLPNGPNTTRYVIRSIDRSRGPADMWFADIEFAPREEPAA